MSTFVLPDLGEGLSEAEILAWQVAEGGHVLADQPLVSVETDKAVVEVPAPYSGTVKALLAQVGDIVAVGAPLVEIDTGKDVDKGAIVGDLGDAMPQHKKPQQKEQAAGQAERRSKHMGAGAKASPAIRKLARDKGIDLTTIRGSGPKGAILSSDVLAAVEGQVAGEDLRGVRRAMARAMTRSGQSVVPATVTDRADISDWRKGENLTVRLVQAVASAYHKEPALNAWFDGTRRQLHDHVDLGLAVDTQDGLIVPVLRGVDKARDIPDQIARLTKAAHQRSLTPAELQGATIALSNFGMLGGEFAALVVSPPQVAILGAGRASDICAAIDGQPAIRQSLPLSLSFDHRAVTGGEAARFLTAVRNELERPTIAGGTD